MNILALDIGKFNTVYCDYICENGEHEFGKVKTNPQAIHDLIVDKEPERVCQVLIKSCHFFSGLTPVA